MAGQLLLDEIPIHCGLSATYIHEIFTNGPSALQLRLEEGLAQLREFLEYVRELNDFSSSMSAKNKSENAAKEPLRYLGLSIHTSWGNCWRRDYNKLPLQRAPSIAAGSPYVQFATYIYAFLGEPCEEPGIISRLKKAEAYYRITAASRRMPKKTQR